MIKAKCFTINLLIWISLLQAGRAQPAKVPQILHILASADHLEAYRIKPAFPPDYSVTNFGGDPILATNLIRSKKFIGGLVSSLQRCKEPAITDCIFSPGVAFRARTKDGTADLLVCFQCDEAMLIRRDAKLNVVENTYFSIRGQRGELLKLALEAFPKDEELKKLK